jgi:hypothetical protein
MVYRVAWIRLLIQVTGSTIYTFGLTNMVLSLKVIGQEQRAADFFKRSLTISDGGDPGPALLLLD